MEDKVLVKFLLHHTVQYAPQAFTQKNNEGND